MKFAVIPLVVLTSSVLLGQDSNPTQQTQNPNAGEASGALYHVDVVARTTKAVNYGHRAAPTKIDLVGTVLQHDAKGEARIEAAARLGRVGHGARGQARPAVVITHEAEELLPPRLGIVLEWARQTIG